MYPSARRLLLPAACAAALLALPFSLLRAQAPPASALAQPPVRWAQVAAANEERIVNYDHSEPLRYQVKKIDDKGETLRMVVESRDGSVARLIQQNGQPLTADENAAERDRLQAILDSPDAFARHIRADKGSRSYATELLRSMAKSMLWSYAPGQPQLPGAPAPAVVLDFKPDPNFTPPSLITEGLTGIAGRVWVDENTQCVTRIQGEILHSVDFGWGGILARVKQGGQVAFDQRKVANHRWLYTHLVEHFTVREVLLHTVQENVDTTVFDIQPLPTPVSVREAVQTLLALPVPTR